MIISTTLWRNIFKRIFIVSLYIFVITSICSAQMVGDTVYNPFTGELDKIGATTTGWPSGCTSASNFCFIYEDNLVKLYVDGILQSNWPDVAVGRLLLETGDYVLLETGDKIYLE